MLCSLPVSSSIILLEFDAMRGSRNYVSGLEQIIYIDSFLFNIRAIAAVIADNKQITGVEKSMINF